jgi:hypothetical protein
MLIKTCGHKNAIANAASIINITAADANRPAFAKMFKECIAKADINNTKNNETNEARKQTASSRHFVL